MVIGRLAKRQEIKRFIIAWGWRLVENTFRSEVLSILRPGRLGKIELKWDRHRVFQGWKVGLTSKGRRTFLGYDTYPLQLAVVIAPDGTWFYKNEAELEYAVKIGRLTLEQGVAVRAEGERVVAKIDEIMAVGPDDWLKCFDDLPHPTLPEGWDDLSMYRDAPSSRQWANDLSHVK